MKRAYPSGDQKRRNTEFKRQTIENENTQSITLFFNSHDSDFNDDSANCFDENYMYVNAPEQLETIEQERNILIDSQDKQSVQAVCEQTEGEKEQEAEIDPYIDFLSMNDLFSFLWVFNSFNEDDIKKQATTLAEIYSNQLSLEIVDEMLFVKDSANFKLSASPKNILAEMLEMSLIDLFSNISIALRIFLTLPVSVAEAERTSSLQKRVKNYQRSTMKQGRLNGIATPSTNCDMARKLDFSTIIHDFASKKSRRLLNDSH